MIGFEIESYTSDDLLRFVRTLGQHRYVASRLHLIHAFAIDAADSTPDPPDPAIRDAAAWAKRALLSGGAIDLDSKDDRLYRRASDAELNAVLGAFWRNESTSAAHQRLRKHLETINALPPTEKKKEEEEDEPSLSAVALPFDESREDEIFPALIDAGWELLPLNKLDWEKHRGAIQCFDDFEVARFEEENTIPPIVTLHELPVLGGVELLHAFEDDTQKARAPFVLWQDGNETYLDYVLRGILRASKISVPESE